MTSVTSIAIKSNNRFQGDRTNFNIKLQYPVQFKHCRLEEAIIPNSFYNFIDKDITVNDGAPLVATLNGDYTAISIAQTLSVQLAGYVTTFNADLQRFVMTHGAPFTLTLPDTETARRLGFDSLVIASVANQITSDRPPDLQPYKNMFINVRELGLSNVATQTTNPIAFTFKIPVISNRGEYLVFSERSQFFQPMLFNDTYTKLMDFQITLTGDDGVVIDESQINDWMMSLRIE